MTRQKATKVDFQALRELTPAQATAVDLVSVGKSDQEVGEAVGVTRQTVNVWRHHHPAFVAAVNVRRVDLWDDVRDRLRRLLPKALDALERGLDGPDGWRVGLALVKLGAEKHELDLAPGGATEADRVIDATANQMHHARVFAVPEYSRADAMTETWVKVNRAQEVDQVTG